MIIYSVFVRAVVQCVPSSATVKAKWIDSSWPLLADAEQRAKALAQSLIVAEVGEYVTVKVIGHELTGAAIEKSK